jgi:hypothetical protein
MLHRILIAILAISLLLVVVILNLTTPISAGPFGVLALFVFLYLMSLSIVTFFIFSISLVYSHALKALRVRRPRQHLSLNHSYNYATVIALAPVIFIALSSVGGVGVYEVVLVVIFAIFGCIYIAKRIN